MKKLLLYTTLALWAFSAGSNPISLPYILINELYFEEGEWTLELAYYEANQEFFPIVEIFLASSSGETELLVFDITGEEGLILVQNTVNLSVPLFINPEGDVITITWGVDEGGDILYQDYEMQFGDYPNAMVTKPYPGQSIALIQSKYSKDNSPTIGQYNDTTGTMGTLQGTVFDMYLQPVAEETFCFLFYPNCYFTTTNNGKFSVRVLSNIFNSNQIYHKIDPSLHEWLPSEIHYIMEPDSVVNFDIYLLDSLTVGITGPSVSDKGVFRFYPNPATRQLSINYEINLPPDSYRRNGRELTIEIKTIASLQIYTCPVSPGQGIINLPEQILPGIYVVNLRSGQKVLASGRLVINR
ncbi:MAG: hypothetical protein B6D64_08900 [Bacteroidetes bacterium 4484_276]|nr:MAG: hypothetical protein B6D64_08900 [Bacteroidetes bacterium 4484_276]OYT14155.1 MAG: hypothetical protein B6I19_01365 [Bacteroidetes bacterium 4572_114]